VTVIEFKKMFEHQQGVPRKFLSWICLIFFKWWDVLEKFWGEKKGGGKVSDERSFF